MTDRNCQHCSLHCIDGHAPPIRLEPGTKMVFVLSVALLAIQVHSLLVVWVGWGCSKAFLV